MKSRGFLVRLLMALVCLLPVGIGMFSLGDSAFAADSVNVTLHKKKMDAFPTDLTENTGKEDKRFDRYEPLKDVTFTVWNVTDDFYKQLNAKLTGSETDSEYQAKVKEFMIEQDQSKGFNFVKSEAKEVATQTTGDDGTAQFTGLPMRNSKGLYNVYYFEEHKNPKVDASLPVILTLPAIDTDDGTHMENIHLYPKNVVIGGEVEKEVMDGDQPATPNVDGAYDYDIGKEIQFRASYKIPSQIGEVLTNPNTTAESTRYTRLVFKDEVDKFGVQFERIDRIVVDNKDITKDFLGVHTAEPTYKGKPAKADEKAGFEIKTNLNASTSSMPGQNFAKSKAAAKYLEQYAGRKMEIYYTVSLTELTPVDEEIRNKFQVTLDHDGIKDENKTHPELPVITTGGRKVFKYEDPNGQGLGGAKFVVIKKDSNNNDLYLKIDGGKATWLPVGSNEKYDNATQYISDDNGNFEIKGLEYGEYYLREIKAPDGFQKLDQDKDFTIAKGSYGIKPVEIGNVTKDGFLPSTGGAGIIAFLIIGGALMGAAMIRYRKINAKA
ncbi:SpaH/EbpB family LPXTG-anchored major pilin [Candidatus Enterococcus murrayae]|uniref:SpaH/EbpB family LPXTG-anchored major pilin n=1 Tax=Candidatus Enterococcus murrayae TaxID=2815321 RepID=A0ABS3HLG4_9ENTE|nr:SpaH/EbpB family LPXTG-anchored major pilin [Enterococcus sp. MJM16]MBO0454287.1 SpaH/EbpB family LPXTG-anchored major pilin [Enterococcus sp. MJM16]